jgi:hypothetical protein
VGEHRATLGLERSKFEVRLSCWTLIFCHGLGWGIPQRVGRVLSFFGIDHGLKFYLYNSFCTCGITLEQTCWYSGQSWDEKSSNFVIIGQNLSSLSKEIILTSGQVSN